MARHDTNSPATHYLLLNDNQLINGHGVYLNMTLATFEARWIQFEKTRLQAEFDAIWAKFTEEEKELFDASFRPEPT